MTEITETHQVSTEAVVVTGQDLFWHSRTKLPNSTLPIRARAGFRRPLSQLNTMARVLSDGWAGSRSTTSSTSSRSTTTGR